LNVCDHSERPLIMPTDLDAAVAARKRAEKAETQTLITIVLVWAIICLGMLGFLFAVLQRLDG
jgi:hypothetical protein